MTRPDARRGIPQVDRLVGQLGAEADGLPRPMVVAGVRAAVEEARKRVRRTGAAPKDADVLAAARAEIAAARQSLLVPVINATGVLLHTNLGRAPLSSRALDAASRIASGYSNLELDLATGRRGDRFRHVEPLLALATGAEAALVVNNNAAAILLVCAALARGREVVISRGELIEIGGEFRIPDVLAESGAILKEVGTTNRTHLRDYERALGERTALVLRVHPSNYRVVGFTAAPSTRELADLARKAGVPLVFDAGSGLLHRGLGDEPVVSRVLAEGASLVCFSGDKLLGGPQAGVVCGRRRLVARLRTHPLLRPLRPDKLTLAAMQETVLAYLGGRAGELPVWGMLDVSREELLARSRALADAAGGHGFAADVADSEGLAGGGSLPEVGIPGPVVRLTHPARGPKELAAALRAHVPPVIARVAGRALVLDLRTVPADRDEVVASAVASSVERSRPRRR